MKASIVLGLGFGDEGKGITTDFLCSQAHNPVVIRFSGGQQAGHTVIKDGIKHVHSNFGAGTLRGIPTYFTEHTTFYPVTIMREKEVLESKGILNPELVLHPLARITTPFDVIANRKSVDMVNGTCGLGIGKTMKRNDSSPYKLYAIDLLNHEVLIQKLGAIGADYYNITPDEVFTQEMDEFMEAIQTLKWNIRSYDYLRNFNNLIFEGSQGIQLDMEHGVFPNVTYANTTSKNAHYVLDKLGVTERNMYYVTRAYHTRHGVGPFKETPLKLTNNSEEINVLNEYQGNFRVGVLDYNLLNQSLFIDEIYCNDIMSGGYTINNLVVTCCDQIEKEQKMDYSKIKKHFNSVFNSYSPDSRGFVDVTQDFNL